LALHIGKEEPVALPGLCSALIMLAAKALAMVPQHNQQLRFIETPRNLPNSGVVEIKQIQREGSVPIVKRMAQNVHPNEMLHYEVELVSVPLKMQIGRFICLKYIAHVKVQGVFDIIKVS
jgi:hypothetical protein